MAAKEAKIHFGELMDTVQREPVSIKKYGRDVAVVMSAEAYRQIKLERLRVRLSIGELQLDRGNADLDRDPGIGYPRQTCLAIGRYALLH